MVTSDLHSDDFYHVLGVPRSATPDEIKRAYFALVRQYTPERSPEAFKRIRAAYETLSDPAARDRYDTRPNPRIEALVNEAGEAMKAQNFSRAEQLYKQVLLDSPGLDWVRNLLGICFLYQKRPLDAITQYERVLAGATADASMHGNLGHAYSMLRRYDVAEREFRTAMTLAGEQGFQYGLALIEMVTSYRALDEADKVAQELIKAAPVGSRAAAEYYAKQVELALRADRPRTIAAIVHRMTRGLETDDAKHTTAGVLGGIGTRLIAGELFDIAAQVARSGVALLPQDPGFDALAEAGDLLLRGNFDGVARLLRTHVAFAPGGAVQGLREWIEQYLVHHAAYQGMRRIRVPPSTFKFYGIGTTILGERDYDEQTRTHVVTRYFTFFFIPLFPIANYRVRTESSGAKYFKGKVRLRRLQHVHLWGVVGLILALLVLGGGGPPIPESDATRDDSARTRQELPIGTSQYEGEMSDTNQPLSPVRSQVRLTFADLKTSSAVHLFVSPPLTGSGQYLLRARRDSVRLTTLAGDDTISFVGERLGGNVLSGRYGIVGPGVTSKWFGNWRVRLARGDPIPGELNPW